MSLKELNGYEDAIYNGLDDPQLLRTIVLRLIEEAKWLREWDGILREKMERISKESLDCVVSTEKKYKSLLDQGREDHERIARLEAEADWLACNCETLSGHDPLLRQGMSKDQWREEARRATNG